MVRKYERRTESTGGDKSRLLVLLKNISTQAFVGAVAKSAMPAREARELCLEFKSNKD